MKTYGRKRSFQKIAQVDLDFGEVCRLCLCCSDDRHNIFDSESDVPLCLTILTCVSLEVCDGDGLPTEICGNCFKLLQAFYKFRKQCEEVNSKLHDIMKTVNEIKPPENVISDKQEKIKVVRPLLNIECRVEKGIENEFVLNYKNGMNSLLNEHPSIQGNDNCSFFEESLDHRINSLCQKNNISITNNEKYAMVSTTRNEKNSQWQNSDKSILKSGHFQNCENASIDNGKNDSSQDCMLIKHNEHSKSESLNNYVNTESHPTDPSSLIFMCDKCPRKFSKRLDLKRHSSVHVEQRGFECRECEKWFPNKTSYKRHERTHTGERPFSCSYCQKCFSQESILSRHLLIHRGEKHYKCEVCGKSFYQREGLKVHLRRNDHSNLQVQQQLYFCPLCQKGFCHQSGLSRHLITHTGKTFDCPVCSKSYSDQSSLKRHSKRHNSEMLN